MKVHQDALRERLRVDLASVEAQLSQLRETSAVVALDQTAVGRLSRMDALQQQSVAQGMQSRLHLRLRKLQAALVRIDDGRFGQCCKCDDMIEPKRLLTDPTVLFCFDCAVQRENDLDKSR